MNLGIFYKSMREWLPITLFVGLFVALFEIVLAYVAPTFENQIAETLSQIDWLRKILQSILGAEMSDQIDPRAFAVLPWVQPVLLITYLSHAIIGASRMPSHEIERGTIDWLMALPVSRTQLFLIESVCWILNALALTAVLLIGNSIGHWLVESENQSGLLITMKIVFNLFCLYLACGGLAWVTSVCFDRRMVAIGIVLGFIFASILFNFLIPYWPWAKDNAWISIMNFFRPFHILKSESVPLSDVIVLLVIFIGSWLIALFIFRVRGLAAV